MHRGFECVGLDLVPCFTCESFPEYEDDCGNIDEQNTDDYQPWNWGLYSICHASGYYDPCPDEHELLEEAMGLAAAEDAGALIALASASGGKLYVNRERGALQAYGCNDLVTLHILLSDRMVSALDALESSAKLETAPGSSSHGGILVVTGLAGVVSLRRKRRAN